MRGPFLFLPFGTSKMAMLSNRCNFILFLNISLEFAIRWYSPSFGACGSSTSADAAARGEAASFLQRGLLHLLPALAFLSTMAAIGTTARSYAGTKGQVLEASRPPTLQKCKLPLISLISSTLCFHSAPLTALSFAHASTKKMQQGCDCAMTACLSFRGHGANECPRVVMTKQERMSISFLFFWFWFL